MTKPELGEVVRFVVKDSGVGIPPETLPKLFEKFVRAYDAGQVNLIGTGLGLYMSLLHISEPTRLLSISYAVFC